MDFLFHDCRHGGHVGFGRKGGRHVIRRGAVYWNNVLLRHPLRWFLCSLLGYFLGVFHLPPLWRRYECSVGHANPGVKKKVSFGRKYIQAYSRLQITDQALVGDGIFECVL